MDIQNSEARATSAELDAAEHLLYYYGYTGKAGGSFVSNLIRLLEVADGNNRAKLLEAFPQWRVPVTIATTQGLEELQSWMCRVRAVAVGTEEP